MVGCVKLHREQWKIHVAVELHGKQWKIYVPSSENIFISSTILEPAHDKTNKMACVPSKD